MVKIKYARRPTRTHEIRNRLKEKIRGQPVGDLGQVDFVQIDTYIQ